MLERDFPLIADVPEALRTLKHNCGVLGAWQVLKYLGRDVPPLQVVETCHFERDIGTYMIGLADGLRGLGVHVVFTSEPDLELSPTECKLYDEARIHGVEFKPAISLRTLDELIGHTGVALVLYEANEDAAHITPILGTHFGYVVAPNEGDNMTIDWMEERRSRPGILRQSVLCWSTPSKAALLRQRTQLHC